jgi:predicted amidophosphoribosyltransferase
MTYSSVTLKVCEGCGTLWLRSQASLTVYCAHCAERLKHFPDPKTRRRPGRPLKHRSTAGNEALARGIQ